MWERLLVRTTTRAEHQQAWLAIDHARIHPVPDLLTNLSSPPPTHENGRDPKHGTPTTLPRRPNLETTGANATDSSNHSNACQMHPCEGLLGPAMRPVTLRTSQTQVCTGCWDEPRHRDRRLGHAFDQLVLDHHGHVRFLSSFSRECVSSLVTLFIVCRAAINDVVQSLMLRTVTAAMPCVCHACAPPRAVPPETSWGLRG